MRFLFLLISTLLVALIASNIQASDKIIPPELFINEIQTPPIIDGKLDDSCWQSLPEYSGFVDSVDTTLANEQTYFKIAYDKNTIYFSFKAICKNPSAIRAIETKPGGFNMTLEDHIEILIDSQHFHRSSSVFWINAIGTQADFLLSSSSTKVEWKGDWQTGCQITSEGYNMEVAIPFSLLVYENNQESMGLAFIRYHSNDSRRSTWPNSGGNFNTSLYANLHGMKLPINKPKPMGMAYMLSGTGSGGNSKDIGLDLKYKPNNNSVALASINPDLGTIEQDVDSLDFTYTEKYRLDRRPFFQDWELPIDSTIFYPRRIKDFDLGARYSLQNGIAQYGIMHTNLLGEQNNIVGFYQRGFGQLSTMNFGFANHQVQSHNNIVGGGNIRFVSMKGHRRNTITGTFYKSSTSDAKDGNMRYLQIHSAGGDNDWSFRFTAGKIDSSFNPELGYNSQIGTSGKEIAFIRKHTYKNKKMNTAISRIELGDWEAIDEVDTPRSQFITISQELGFVNGTSLDYSINKEARDEFRDLTHSITAEWGKNVIRTSGLLTYTFGNKVGGNYRYLLLEQNLAINSKCILTIDAGDEKISFPSPKTGHNNLLSTSVSYNINNENVVGGRFIYRSGNSNIYLMYKKQARKGADIYFIFGDPNADSTISKLLVKYLMVL